MLTNARTVFLAALVLALVATPHAQLPGRVVTRAPEHPSTAEQYLFYLHGRIVEDQGLEAVSPVPLRLHGDVLSIYEDSDELGRSCRPLFDGSPDLERRREVRLTTGLRHGFIFRPLEAWVGPAVRWAREGA